MLFRSVIEEELAKLADKEFLEKAAPKSLNNEGAMAMVKAFVDNEEYGLADRMNTIVHFIAEQICRSIVQNLATENLAHRKLLATGGGAFNTYLMQVLSDKLATLNIELTIPDAQVVSYKEALVMALIGTLRWREETNTIASQTGASKDSVGGAFWIGA